MSGATVGAREITIRGVVLGALITLVFTAANVYLGLRVGLTFATSIPAAVISMGVLRLFANHSVVENNIVQTIASAAGTLSSIIFVLPALLMIGWWSGFPYWTTAAVCALGGILGVMYSIPLRRALVTGSDLPYPEGVAGAEVLKIGDSAREMEHNRRGIGVIALGAAAAAGYALLASLRVINNSLSATFRVGSGATMIGASLSLALIGVGHLVGVTVGVAMIVGLAIAFGVMLPIRTAGQLPPDGDYAVAVARIFSTDVRFIGAGAIAVAAAWTFLKILGPILRGIADAAVSARTRRRGQAVGQTERDIPIHIVAMVVLLSLIPIGWLLADFTDGTPLDDRRPGAIAAGVLLVLVIGLMVAAVCGYMAGLIGSSNSPISGVGILVVVLAGLLIKTAYGPATGSQIPALVAYTVFTAALVFGVATISNDNLQGPQNRPTRRRYPMEAAGCTDHRRARRVGGDGADPAADAGWIRVPGGAGRNGQRIGRPASRAHVRAGQGSIWWLAELVAGRCRGLDRRDSGRARRDTGQDDNQPSAAATSGGYGYVPVGRTDADDPDRRIPRADL